MNPHLQELDVDILHLYFLYHLGLDTSSDLKAQFGDVTYVIMQGSGDRAKELALFLSKELNIPFSGKPIGKTERFFLYKVGYILCVSHGMGMPSLSILLHEMYKLLYYAGCLSKCTILRSGTCGGVGVEPGTVAITTGGVDPSLHPFYTQSTLGKDIEYPSIAEKNLVHLLQETASNYSIPSVCGLTISADGFYEDQGRLDGFFCDYLMEDKFEYLKKVHNAGVCNIEMEALLFLAFAQRAHVRAGVLCTVIVNRLKGDQVTSTHEQLDQYMIDNWTLLSKLIKEHPCIEESIEY